jgi:hypothetical protein
MSFDKIFNRFYLIITKYSLTNSSNVMNKNFIEYYDNRSTDLGVSSNSKKYYI